jgi:hypothetical protein
VGHSWPPDADILSGRKKVGGQFEYVQRLDDCDLGRSVTGRKDVEARFGVSSTPDANRSLQRRPRLHIDRGYAMQDMGTALLIANLVGLAVVAILVIPCLLFFRGWTFRVLPALGALFPTLLAMTFGLVVTGLAVAHPRLENAGTQTSTFVLINAVLAAAVAIPGGLVGLFIAWLIERGKPAGTGPPERCDRNLQDI